MRSERSAQLNTENKEKNAFEEVLNLFRKMCKKEEWGTKTVLTIMAEEKFGREQNIKSVRDDFVDEWFDTMDYVLNPTKNAKLRKAEHRYLRAYIEVKVAEYYRELLGDKKFIHFLNATKEAFNSLYDLRSANIPTVLMKTLDGMTLNYTANNQRGGIVEISLQSLGESSGIFKCKASFIKGNDKRTSVNTGLLFCQSDSMNPMLHGVFVNHDDCCLLNLTINVGGLTEAHTKDDQLTEARKSVSLALTIPDQSGISYSVEENFDKSNDNRNMFSFSPNNYYGNKSDDKIETERKVIVMNQFFNFDGVERFGAFKELDELSSDDMLEYVRNNPECAKETNHNGMTLAHLAVTGLYFDLLVAVSESPHFDPFVEDNFGRMPIECGYSEKAIHSLKFLEYKMFGHYAHIFESSSPSPTP